MVLIIIGTIFCLTSIGMVSNLKPAVLGGVLLIIGLFCIKKGREKLGWGKTD